MNVEDIKTYVDIEKYVGELQEEISRITYEWELEKRVNSTLNKENVGVMKENEELKAEHDKLLCKIKTQDKQIERFKTRINELEEVVLKRTFVKKTREISDSQIYEIKVLRDSGMSYREIEKTTGWSKFTIGKVVNGEYDK